MNTIGAAIPALEPVRAASPFRWADASTVLLHGPGALRPLGTLLVAAVLAALGALAFGRRDIGAASLPSPRRRVRQPRGAS